MTDPSKSNHEPMDDEEGEAFGYSIPEDTEMNSSLSHPEFSGLDQVVDTCLELSGREKLPKYENCEDIVKSIPYISQEFHDITESINLECSSFDPEKTIELNKLITNLFYREIIFLYNCMRRQKIVNSLMVKIGGPRCCWTQLTFERKAVKRSHQFTDENGMQFNEKPKSTLTIAISKQNQWYYFLLRFIVHIGVVTPKGILYDLIENILNDTNKLPIYGNMLSILKEIKNIIPAKKEGPQNKNGSAPAPSELPTNSSGQANTQMYQSMEHLTELLHKTLDINAKLSVDLTSEDQYDTNEELMISDIESLGIEIKEFKENIQDSTKTGDETSTPLGPCLRKITAQFEQLLYHAQDLSAFPVLYSEELPSSEEVKVLEDILEKYESIEPLMNSIIDNVAYYYGVSVSPKNIDMKTGL